MHPNNRKEKLSKDFYFEVLSRRLSIANFQNFIEKKNSIRLEDLITISNSRIINIDLKGSLNTAIDSLKYKRRAEKTIKTISKLKIELQSDVDESLWNGSQKADI